MVPGFKNECAVKFGQPLGFGVPTWISGSAAVPVLAFPLLWTGVSVLASLHHHLQCHNQTSLELCGCS